jgi:hypothetical protein
MYDGINSGHIRFSGQGEQRRGAARLEKRSQAGPGHDRRRDAAGFLPLRSGRHSA